MRRLLGDVLTEEGFTVYEASNGSSALRIVEREQPDLVLLDLNLPEISGLAVLAQLRAAPATARLPVIVVARRVDELERVSHDAQAVVARPFGASEVHAAVEAVARGAREASEMSLRLN
jgi:DNA-binding response OmpR family regulator